MKPILEACIPLYGAGARFRIYLRLREYFRKNKMGFLGQCLKVHLQRNYGCELSVKAVISPKCSFMHTSGVVIGDGCVVESGVVIYSGVVLGRKDIFKDDDYPTIEENVVLSTGAAVLGKCNVGRECIIGAQALVLSNCEPGGVYVGSPAVKVK